MKDFFEAIEAHDETALVVAVFIFAIVSIIADAIRDKNTSK